MAGERGGGKGSGGEDDKEGASITIEVLQQHFHQPLVQVADELGVSLTMIKRLCRKLGMPRWPYRQIDSINKAMEDLHDQLENARTEADRARYRKLLEAALKKKRLITRGAAAGVDPNVRNVLYLADTANVSEEDIFGNPELMPKLSAALKKITKRKRVKGKPLVELIATVQRDGSLPACVQSSSSNSGSSGSTPAISRAAPTGTPSTRTPGPGRRFPRPPSLVDAIATSNEEYKANMEQAFGNVNRPGSSASAATSVSPALSSLGNGAGTNNTSEDHARLGWGHSSAYRSQWGRQTPGSARGATGGGGMPGGPLSSSHQGRGTNEDRIPRDGFGPPDGILDSPASSCTTLVATTSPGAGDRFSPGGSLPGGFSPAKKCLSPATNELAQRHARMARSRHKPSSLMEAGVIPGMIPEGAQSAPAAGTSAHPSAVRASHWGQFHQSPRCHKPQKRLSTTSSLASTDVESLDTSHLLEFDDDDDDDDPTYGGQPYTSADVSGGNGEGLSAAHVAPGAPRPRAATIEGRTVSGASAAGGSNEQHEPYGVSPEDLQELEDVLLMDSFGVIDELLEGEDIPGPFPDLQHSRSSFPDLQNVGASLPPLPRSGQRGTPRGSVSAGASSPQQLLGQPMFGGASPSHAPAASPGGTNGSVSNFGLPGATGSTVNGAPRPTPRSISRSRNQVPPRPYTPGKSSRGGSSTPWLSHGLNGGVSPRVGSSPRPPTPGTPSGARLNGHSQARGAQPGPSPKNRRRGDEAFPEFAMPSPNEHGAAGRGAPSPKARRVGARAFPERFPGSPLAGASAGCGASPRVGFPPQSPRSSSGAATSGALCGAPSPLDGGNARAYFPASVAANGVSRGQSRTSSNNWCTAPMHGSTGDVVDATTVMSATGKGSNFQMSPSSQNWDMRLSDGKPTGVLQSTSGGRHGWAMSSGGDMQNIPPSPSPRRASTGLSNVSETGTSTGSSGGGVLNLGTVSNAEAGSRWNNNHSGINSTNERTAQSSWATGASTQGYSSLQRRHSAPIPAGPPQPAAAASNGDICVGQLKREDVSGTAVNTTNDEFGQAVGHGAVDPNGVATATGWAPPAPPPSPMPEQLVGEASASAGGSALTSASASARDPSLSFDEQDSAWWAPLGRISNGGLESSQAPVPATLSTSSKSLSLETGGDVDSKLEGNSGLPLIMGL